MNDTDPAPAYLSDTAYPATCHRELSPAWLRHAAAVNGADTAPLDQPFRYLELGCGRGVSTVMHAAAFPRADVHGCDADAACIASARGLAAALGVDNVTFHHARFDTLLELPPERFDFVAAHGVYSWVDETARAALRRLMATRLAPGGIAYLSYNCMPGWTSEIPLRRLLVELAGAATGSSSVRAADAAAGLNELRQAGGRFFDLHPDAAAAVGRYQRQPAGYLAHEFLNPTFEPCYSVDVADRMADEGLELLGSATLADNHEPLLLGDTAAGVIAAMATPRLRQLAVDFAVHRRFRRDLFTRCRDGAALARPPGRQLLVGCLEDPSALPDTAHVPRGVIRFEPQFVRAVGAGLADGPVALESLVGRLTGGDTGAERVLRNLLYMVAAGMLSPCAGRPAAGGSGPLACSSDVVRRAVEVVAERGEPGWIPSEAYGTGLPCTVEEARNVLEHVSGRRRALTEAHVRRHEATGMLRRGTGPDGG